MSLALLFALAVLAQETAPTTPPADEPVADQGRAAIAAQAAAASASSAPTDDFGFLAWCSGALDGYLEIKPRVMGDVRRIESRFREPGRTLAQDMQVYAEIEKDGRANRASFRRLLVSAEGGDAGRIQARADGYAHGRAVWTAAADAPTARLAQEWMSWTLPGRCDSAAKHLSEVGEDVAKTPAG